MSLRYDDFEPPLRDQYADEDALYLVGGPLPCDCGACPGCMPELFDEAELDAGRREERAA